MRLPPARPRAGSGHGSPPSYAEASRGFSHLSRLTCRTRTTASPGGLIVAGLGWLLSTSPGPAAAVNVSEGFRVEVVVSGLPRPVQLAHDGEGMLRVLGHGWRGDAAGELYRIDLRGSLPVDAARAPRVVVPFASEPRKTVFGSLAVDSRTGDLYLGEENGNRTYRLRRAHALSAARRG